MRRCVIWYQNARRQLHIPKEYYFNAHFFESRNSQ